MRENRSRWFGIAAAVFAIAAAVWWWNAHRAPAAPPEAAAPSVPLATARYGAIDVTVHAVGRIGSSAGAETKLAFATAGRIGSIAVHVGDRVSAGDALAMLDAGAFTLAAQQAQADAGAAAAQARGASVDRITTKLAVDEAALARAQRLYAAGVTARKDIEAAQAQVAADRADAQSAVSGRQAAQAQAASASAKAALAQRDVSNATLRSPIDGVVTSVMRSAGESVDPTIAVVAVAPSSNAHVSLTVTGADAARIAAGDPVTIHTGGDRTISGRVAGVSGALDPATQSAQVLVVADVPSAFAGSAVDATIVVAHDRGVLVPKTAIVADPSSGKTLVFVSSKDKDGNPAFEQRDVEVLSENGPLAEVRGVRPGERIASEGAFELLAPSGGGG